MNAMSLVLRRLRHCHIAAECSTRNVQLGISYQSKPELVNVPTSRPTTPSPAPAPPSAQRLAASFNSIELFVSRRDPLIVRLLRERTARVTLRRVLT